MNWLESLELASVPVNPVTSKSVSVSAIRAESEEEELVSKSQCKWEKKISAQSSQIKDLHTKLDGAIAENVQIWELLNPATLCLQTAG